jgi:hypothetical protein
MMDDMPDILEQVFWAMLFNVYTATPGIIQSYTAKTKSAVVLPTIKITYADGTIASLPKINHVQVIFPGTKRSVIQYKLGKGDGCLLIFSKQALDNWINSSGDQVADGDSRSFSLTDAFCIPGLFPTKAPGKIGGGTGLEIIHETGKIQFTDDGNIELNGNSKSFVTHDELNTALQNFISALNTHTHSNGNNGSPTGAPLTSMSIDLSNCKTTTILTGG